jgi:hypothetical protein
MERSHRRGAVTGLEMLNVTSSVKAFSAAPGVSIPMPGATLRMTTMTTIMTTRAREGCG